MTTPIPQNHLVYKGLQGITCEQFTLQNGMLGNCRWGQAIDSRGAKNTTVERHDAGQTAPSESGPRLRARLRVAAWTAQGGRGPRRVPPHPVAIPRTGPHGARRAVSRHELRRRGACGTLKRPLSRSSSTWRACGLTLRCVTCARVSKMRFYSLAHRPMRSRSWLLR